MSDHQKVEMAGILCQETNSVVQVTDDGTCPYCGADVDDD